MDEYFAICQEAVKKYIHKAPEEFREDQLILMLECNCLCRISENHEHEDEIKFYCASICLDCLDPATSTEGPEIRHKLERIQGFLRDIN